MTKPISQMTEQEFQDHQMKWGLGMFIAALGLVLVPLTIMYLRDL